MKRYNGFTLIELLGVLILLAVIALITYPIIDKVLSNAKNQAYERQKDSIIEAARLYVTTNGNYSTSQTQLSFQTLIDSGYLKEGEILDPRDSSKEMPGCVIYNWNESKNQYMFEYSEDCIVTTSAECFTYQDYEDGIEITGYDNKCGGMDVVLPESIDGKNIVSIGEAAFGHKGEAAFGHISIGYNDNSENTNFMSNSSSDYIINSINMIYAYKLKYIKEYAFAENQLTNVTIPDSVISIGRNAFMSNNLISVIISNNITIIEYATFLGNQLTNVTIPNSVIEIGSSAFDNNQLTNVTIPNSVNIINNYAFSDNQLTNITIPNSVIEIGSSAFRNNQLTNVTIPNSVTTIGEYAFYGNQLTSVTIPNSVTTIEKCAFNNNKLPDTQAFIYARNNDGILDKTTIINYGGEKRENIVIPNNVTTIGEYAFSDNDLTSVTIPNSVITIGEYAFRNNQLTNVTIPNSVTTIGEFAFYGNQLTSVTIPNSVTTIGYRSFFKNDDSNSNLIKIINQTGKAFNWGNIINWVSGYNFETGTVVNEYGNVEIIK